MRNELDHIREMLRNLTDLRAHKDELARRLPDLTQALEEERWLDPEDAENLAGQLRRFALSQRTFLAWAEHALEQHSPATMGELSELLTRRERELVERDRVLRPCRAFLALEAEEPALKTALADRQEALRRAMEEGGDLELWSRGCTELLEQLTARDYGRIGAIMDQYGALFDFPLVAGVYSGAITAPAEETPAEEPQPEPVDEAPVEEPAAPVEELPAEEPQPEPVEEAPVEEPAAPVEEIPAEEPRPEPVEEAPVEEPAAPVEELPAEEPQPEPVEEAAVEEAPSFWPGTPTQDRAESLTFVGPRRFESPSGKKFVDQLRRPDFRELYHKLRTSLIFTEEEHREHPDFPDTTLRHAVREGYVTQVTLGDGRSLYFTSPKLLSAVGKSSVHRYLDSQGIAPITGAVEERALSPELLEQPAAVYRALKCLYDDQRLKEWELTRLCKWRDQVCYETYVRFECEGQPTVLCRIAALTDPGADRRAAFLARLSAFLTERTEPVWLVVPTGAEVPAWREYLAAHDLPIPFWLPLDQPGCILSPEGEASSLTDLFLVPSAPEGEHEPAEEPVPEAETEPVEAAEPETEPEPAEEPAPAAEPEPVEEPAPETEPEPAEKPEPETEPEPAEEPAPVAEPEPVEEPAPEAEPEPAEKPAPEAEPEPETVALTQTVEPAVPAQEEVRPGLFTLDVDREQLWRQAVEWFAEEDFQLGLCLLRVLGGLDKDLAPRYLQFAYALDDPSERCQYLPDRLTQVYADAGTGLDGDTLSCLFLSAYLRMAFTAEAGQAWYQAADALQSITADPLVETLPSVRAALELLVRTLRERRRGFEPQLIRQCQMWGDTHQKLEELARTARDLRDGRLFRVDVYTNRIKSLFEVLFGPQSQLMECISIVEQADTGRRGRVLELYGALLDSDGHPDQRAIAKYIDRVWDEQPSKYKQKDPLKGKARNLAFSRFHTCLELCAQWLECSEAAAIGQEEAEQILLDRDRLLELFQAAQRELGSDAASGNALRYAASVVLRFTLEELVRSLKGEPVDRREFYVDFLRTGQVELSGELLPVFESAEYIIPGFEPWTRLAEHRRRMLAGEGTDWESVVERIWSGDRAEPDCYNFGTARCIDQLTAHRDARPTLLDRADLDADIRQVTGIVDEEELQFRARLELAATYGQIEDHARKEQLSNAVTEVLRPHYEENSNWGFYRRTMEACLAAVQREAERLEPRYRYEFNQLKEQVPPCPMFDKIEQLLQEKMFSVAHDYMQLVAREDLTVPPESNVLSKAPEQDYLRRFLQEQYAPLSRLCMEERGQGRTLEHIYNQFAGDAGQDKNSTKRSARLMIRAWPKNNNTTPEMVQELLRHLSFPVQRVSRGGEANTFHAEMTPAAAHVFTYPHPIAAFGTQLSRTGLNVRVLSGRKTAEELVDLINRLGRTDVPTLFLLDYALPLPERNAMARKLKRESAHLSTCLVLDRILALFLTGYPDAERGKVFLQCALPFHFYNPYVKGDTPIPPEMFMGRKAQLEEILRNGGANIIYGGRQLGKTALLRRAADLVDDREQGQWAVYTDVLYRCDYPEALDKLYACLTACGFLNAASTPKTWEELCERIRARMDDPAKRVERFLLLMDEADQFLASSAACSYRPVELLHQLQTATDGRFKYVLAGLHNVMRFSREATRNNSILGKLGTLTIKPLTYQEASQLLEEPLYYLGFRLDRDQTVLLSQILLSTNYYPGLIHFYCAQLVESLCSSMSTADACPPYRLDENQIRVLLQKKDFTAQIRDKFFITLDVEEDKLYYRILAYALAYCYYDQPEGAVQGYTFQDIWGVCQEFSISSITALEPASVQVLLSEMEELNVLVCMNGRYTFNGANFRHMMGDYETVFEELDRFGEEVE